GNRLASVTELGKLGPHLKLPITGSAGCCARAANGHAAALPSPAMNSRRRISDLLRLDRQPIPIGALCLALTQSFFCSAGGRLRPTGAHSARRQIWSGY